METPHRLGIHAGLGFHVPFSERIQLFRDAGFDSISLWWEERHERARELRHLAPDMVRKTGLHLDNIHVPYYCCNDLWSGDDFTRRRALDLHRSWIDDASRHDIPTVVMHATLGMSPPEKTESALDSFRALTDHAGEQGVVLALENTRSDAHIAWLLDRIDSPQLGLCFDTAHSRLWGESPLHLLEQFPHRLAAVHLSDTDGKRDLHWTPGRGVVDFAAVMARIDASDFTGTLLLEVTHRRDDSDFEEFLKETRDAASRLFQHQSSQSL